MDPWIRGVTTLGWACIPPEHRKSGAPRGDKRERERERERESASLPEHRNRKGAEPTRANDVTGQRARTDFIRWWDRTGSLTLPMLLLGVCTLLSKYGDAIRFQAKGRILKYFIKLLKIYKIFFLWILYFMSCNLFYFIHFDTQVHIYRLQMMCRAKVARSPDESRGTRTCFDTQACLSFCREPRWTARGSLVKGLLCAVRKPGWLMSSRWFKQNVGVSARGRNCPGNLPHCDLVHV